MADAAESPSLGEVMLAAGLGAGVNLGAAILLGTGTAQISLATAASWAAAAVIAGVNFSKDRPLFGAAVASGGLLTAGAMVALSLQRTSNVAIYWPCFERFKTFSRELQLDFVASLNPNLPSVAEARRAIAAGEDGAVDKLLGFIAMMPSGDVQRFCTEVAAGRPLTGTSVPAPPLSLHATPEPTPTRAP